MHNFLLINVHVIRGDVNLPVSFGKLTVPAKVIGTEPRKDIAVLKVTSPQALESLRSFQPFETVSSRDLQVGQQTLAIGNTFGLDSTLTVGVILALALQIIFK